MLERMAWGLAARPGVSASLASAGRRLNIRSVGSNSGWTSAQFFAPLNIGIQVI